MNALVLLPEVMHIMTFVIIDTQQKWLPMLGFIVTLQKQKVPTHSFNEAGVKLIFCKDVQMEALDAEEHSRLNHGESLLQPLPAGHHSQVHGRFRPGTSRLLLSLLAHDVPEREDRIGGALHSGRDTLEIF